MSAEDWHRRWREQRIGFHNDAVNPRLRAWWPTLGVPADATVFVPLCGKSVDMHWLAARGHRVVGIELSPIAVADFFREAGLQAVRGEAHGMAFAEHGRIRIYCGDFFALTPAMLGPVAACFDRAALIALDTAERRRYLRHMATLMPPGSVVLLVTLDYPQAQMDGPPFAVSPAEVDELCAGRFSVRCLDEDDVLGSEARFRERGVTRMHERCYRLERMTRDQK